MRLTLLLALLPTLAFAQSSTPRPEDLGTVTGHITCADTQRPARNAGVELVPIKPADDSDYEALSDRWGKYGPIHTDLDGAYTLTDVPPGQYYLRIDLTGYATPISRFSTDELRSPAREIQQRIQRELQIITVTPNSTTRADATLRRGASISGTILYDDGSPTISINVQLFRRDASGELRPAFTQNTSTDSHGRFTIESLTPGEYILQLVLRSMERRMASMSFNDGKPRLGLSETDAFNLPIYSGNVFREKAAEIIKLDAGQETDGVDITIPLGHLHEISGTLLAMDGHAINNGAIVLLFADTKERLAGTTVDEHGNFRLRYVPEGSYVLKVIGGSDSELVEVSDASHPGSPTHFERHTTRSYGGLQQPITVQTSDQFLNLTVPDKPTPPNNSRANN